MKRETTRKPYVVPMPPDTSKYAEMIVGKWKNTSFVTGSVFYGDIEFTKDGKVLFYDLSEKKWNERYEYTLDKASLIVKPSPTAKPGLKEHRMEIRELNDGKLDLRNPSRAQFTRMK